MVHAEFDECATCTIAAGLTQWDYGQILKISGVDAPAGTEVHYAANRSSCDAIITVAELKEGNLYSAIPNKLLETGEDIRAYVYVADPDKGETVRTIEMPVKRRKRPGDYSAPAEKNLLRSLIEEVSGKADGILLDDEEGYMQLTSKGAPIGDRIRYPTVSGREIEIRNNGMVIEWRYTDSNKWTTLVDLDDLRGETPEFEIREGHLVAIYKR